MFPSGQVTLGKSRVLAQVSCQVTEPRLARCSLLGLSPRTFLCRPNEGILLVNVELSPIAAPGFEAGRMSDEGVEINRTLERCLKESRCLDLESLCIISEEKVWTVRLDLHVLCHEGSLADACSVAGLAALAHFRYL
jgi:exosome complex component RRP45